MYASKCALLDSVLLMELTGRRGDFFSVFDSISNMNDLQDYAKSSKDAHLLQSSYVFKVLIEYWKGDYLAAEEYSNMASAILPAAKMPTIYLIYHTFFRGLVLFGLSRQEGNKSRRLEEGKKALAEMEKWSNLSMPVFENKWRLLMACHATCTQKHDEALKWYGASIKLAQEHGLIHELALAFHLQGDHLHDCGYSSDASESYNQAYTHYKQWGAHAVADRLLRNMPVNELKFEV